MTIYNTEFNSRGFSPRIATPRLLGAPLRSFDPIGVVPSGASRSIYFRGGSCSTARRLSPHDLGRGREEAWRRRLEPTADPSEFKT